MKKVIYIIQPLKDENVVAIRETAPEYDIFCEWKEKIPEDRLKDIEIILGGNRGFTDKVLGIENNSLKWIQVHSAGIDYLDLEALRENNILLSNTSGIHARPIAEHVVAVLLSKSRSIRESIYNQINKEWDHRIAYDDLAGKKMLIFGAGRVGAEVAKLANAFDIEVTGINLIGEPIPNFKEVAKMDEMEKFIGDQDIILNILPLTSATEHFFNTDIFQQMKDGVQFISSGRGPTVDTGALIEAIHSRKIGFAFLDVFEEEPLPKSSPLWNIENTLITAHIAGQVPHFKTKVTAIYLENLRSYLKNGAIIRNKINYSNGF